MEISFYNYGELSFLGYTWDELFFRESCLAAYGACTPVNFCRNIDSVHIQKTYGYLQAK